MISILISLVLAQGVGDVRPGMPVAFVAAASATTQSVPPLGDRFCVSITATPATTWAATSYNLMAAQGANLACAATNAAGLQARTSLVDWSVEDGVGNCTVLSSPATFAGSVTYRVTGCASPGRMVLCRDGVILATSVVPRSLNNTTAATWNLGNAQAGASAWGGTLTNFRVCRGATNCSDCP